MNELTLSQLEQLLRRMREAEVPEDACHRYALRRALLNSHRFERNRIRLVWTRAFAYTTSMVVGGAVVAVLVVSVLSVELDETRRRPSVSARERVPIELVSFTQRPELRQVLEFASPSVQFAVSR